MRATLLIPIVVIGIPAALLLFWVVHLSLDRLCVSHARRFCRRHSLEIQRLRWQPQFDSFGVKTEFTAVYVDCIDSQRQRRLLVLSVWLFGVHRRISDRTSADSFDVEWPRPDD